VRGACARARRREDCGAKFMFAQNGAARNRPFFFKKQNKLPPRRKGVCVLFLDHTQPQAMFALLQLFSKLVEPTGRTATSETQEAGGVSV
jgi:hypothetical protein